MSSVHAAAARRAAATLADPERAGGRRPSRSRRRARRPAARAGRTRSARRSLGVGVQEARRRRRRRTDSARHIASPLPSTGPKLRQQRRPPGAPRRRRARRRRRCRPPSPASTTTTSSIALRSRSADQRPRRSARPSARISRAGSAHRDRRPSVRDPPASELRCGKVRLPVPRSAGSAAAPTMASRGRRPGTEPWDDAARGRARRRAAGARGATWAAARRPIGAAPRRAAPRAARRRWSGGGIERALRPPGRGAGGRAATGR